MEEKDDGEPHGLNREEAGIPIQKPHLGMKFQNDIEAWNFWNAYAAKTCFEVKKRYANKRKDGKVRSCRFACSKEGHRKPDKRDHLTKNPRAETRTGCDVRMGLSLDKESDNYVVIDLVLEHNHDCYLPHMTHLMSSQRKISELQGFEIEMADDSGIGSKAAHELASRQVGGSSNLSYTLSDHQNYLRTKRQSEMGYGQAGSMLKYFQDKIVENPSFQYVMQMDCEEQITNIFWADAKMIIDYAHFGDVVTFDTTFGTNKESRPFGVFVGFNHFRETVVFGAALMYDETFDFFKWLFETFLKTHNGKQPKTIFTDQDSAMGKAVEKVFIDAWHGLCIFHIMQNAVKHLSPCEGSGILSAFSACMYEYEDKEKFEKEFDIIRSKLQKKTWLDSIYKVKEKWAECYMIDVYTLGMRSTQLSESLNSDLKDHFKSGFDMLRFLKHFERVVQGKRDKELDSHFNSIKKQPRIWFRTAMLVQAGNLYTPIIFEAFQKEYERSVAACARSLDGENEYFVAVGNEDLTFEKEYKVVGNSLDQTVVCACNQFWRIGILCAHALKVLDLMNIKALPSEYILKRWTRDARRGSVHDIQGRNIIENPKFDALHRKKHLSNKFLSLVEQVASSPECCLLIDNKLDILSKEVLDQFNASGNTSRGLCASPVDVQTPNIKLLRNACLKKKKVQIRSSLRKRTWLDKKQKGSSRTQKKAKLQECTNYGLEAQVAQNDTPRSNMTDSGQYGTIDSFTQLLMGSNSDVIGIEEHIKF